MSQPTTTARDVRSLLYGVPAHTELTLAKDPDEDGTFVLGYTITDGGEKFVTFADGVIRSTLTFRKD